MTDTTSDTATGETWKDSLTQLSSLLAKEDSNAKKISQCCSQILNDDDDAANAPNNHNKLRTIVSKIYLRALLQLGNNNHYSTVVEFCQASKNSSFRDDFAEEEAYALYRLKKYDACRKFCEGHGMGGSVANTNTNKNDPRSNIVVAGGLRHVYAQSLYRLGETRLADEVYRQLLLSDSSSETTMDEDEREDALSNALANRIANYTTGSYYYLNNKEGGGSITTSSSECWLERDATILGLLQEYGSGSTVASAEGVVEGEGGQDCRKEILQNYDLAYNLATFLLISSEARSPSVVKQAKKLLTNAEKSALTILESSSNAVANDEDEEADGDENAELKKQQKQKQLQQQQQLAEQEAGPIRANLALSNILLGGEENEMAALRTYLTMVTKAAKSGSAGKSGAAGIQGNLLATASNNLAVLRDGKESVFDVLKRIPTTSSLSVSEETTSASSSGGGGAAVVPLVGATPQQVRTALFNRALQLAKMGNANGCLEVLGVLRASLLVSSNGDGSVTNGTNGTAASAGGSSKKSSGKGKKKKGSVSSATGNGGEVSKGSVAEDVPTAKPSSEVEAAAWRARADLLESELFRLSSSDDSKKEKSPDDLIIGAIANLDEVAKKHGSDDAWGVVPYTKSQLILHRAISNNPQLKTQPLIDAIESLPSEIKSCPGTTTTLASLYGSLNNTESASKAEELLASLGGGISAKLALAEFKIEKAQYEEAVELLETISEESDEAEAMMATALLVQALSYVNPEKAAELAEELQDEMMESGDDELDGEELESMDIPRFTKKVGASGEGGSSSKVRKLIEATGGKRGSNLGERKKKNREAILRKRAKQREAYLARLQAEGRYNPDQTPLPKPDPERWIPKSQRSYNRRGRRGRYKSNIGAQGGGAGAGMEKDAAKLDVAARVAAAKAGVVEGSGKPSTANIKVTGGSAVRKGKGGRRR